MAGLEEIVALEQIAGGSQELTLPAATLASGTLTATVTRFTFWPRGRYQVLAISGISVVSAVIDPSTIELTATDRARSDLRLPIRPDMQAQMEWLEADHNGRIILQGQNANLADVVLSARLFALLPEQRARLSELLLNKPRRVEVV